LRGTVTEYARNNCLDPRNADSAKEVGDVDAWGHHDGGERASGGSDAKASSLGPVDHN
jgi:hypothetical protein